MLWICPTSSHSLNKLWDRESHWLPVGQKSSFRVQNSLLTLESQLTQFCTIKKEKVSTQCYVLNFVSPTIITLKGKNDGFLLLCFFMSGQWSRVSCMLGKLSIPQKTFWENSDCFSSLVFSTSSHLCFLQSQPHTAKDSSTAVGGEHLH